MEQKDGQYHCKKCDAKGNLITMKKHFGDTVARGMGEVKQFNKTQFFKPIPEKRVTETHDTLFEDTEVLEYLLDKRKLDVEIVKQYKLGVSVDKDGVKWLTIPHYENGKLMNVKSRSLPPAEKTFRRVKDSKSILFNSDCIKTHLEQIFICEGEIDALTLLSIGVKAVVAVTNGASSFDPEWIDQLSDVSKIVLCYDSDEVGQKGAKEAARRLGYARCYNLVLPKGQDINDFFLVNQEVKIAQFTDLVNSARRFDVAGISSFGDCLDKMEREFNSFLLVGNGLHTEIAPLDRLNPKGMRGGELWILAAPPGIGKSSLALQIITNQALKDIPALFFSMEMNINAVSEKIIQASSRRNEIRKHDIDTTRTAYLNKPLYIGRAVVKPNIEGMVEILRESIKRYGLQMLAFDHLHFLCRSLTNQVQEIGLAVQAFKLLAEEMEIPIILVAQPRKVDLSKPMTAEDLKDSSSIHSDADGIIILHRKRITGEGLATVSLDPITMVRYEKTRYGRGGECLLHFHGEFSKFEEVQ